MEPTRRPASPSDVAMKGVPAESPKKKKKRKKKAKRSTSTNVAAAEAPQDIGGSSTSAVQPDNTYGHGPNIVVEAAADNGSAHVSLLEPPPPYNLFSQAMATDRLTQLQDCLDQLAQQMFASLRYVSNHHPSAPIEGQPFHGRDGNTIKKEKDAGEASQAEPASTPAAETPGSTAEADNDNKRPESPESFAATLRELSRDLVLKEQQVEYLVSVLPAIGATQESQETRIQELIKELEGLDEEVKEADKLKRNLINKVENKILKCHRVWK